jgi:predicted lipoprotein with Yx(FWY)xxD motif
MKNLLIAMGMLAASSLSAFAAEPAKMVDTKMGKVWATEKGMTLYTFDKDTKGKSNCDEKCLKNWPAFHADAKAKAEGEWSLVKAADGKEMWAYEGKPLYMFAKDKKSGDMNGDGVGGVWHVAK